MNTKTLNHLFLVYLFFIFYVSVDLIAADCPVGTVSGQGEQCVCEKGSYSSPQLFPPANARALDACFGTDINSALTDTCTVSGEPYGNGVYTLKFSSFYDDNWSPHYLFDRDTANGFSMDAAFERNTYNSNGDYTGSQTLNGISGEWIHISIPTSVKMTSMEMFTVKFESGTAFFPKTYTILGRNSDTDSWTVIYNEQVGTVLTSSPRCVSTSDLCANVQDIVTDVSFTQIAVVFKTIRGTGGYVSFAELNIYGTSVETCTSCPVGLTTLEPGAESQSACVCQSGSFTNPLPPAVLHWNPSLADESMGGTAATGYTSPAAKWNIATNGGFTIILKVKITDSSDRYAAIFHLADPSTTAFYLRIGRNEWQNTFILENTPQCGSEWPHLTFTYGLVYTIVYTYDASSQKKGFYYSDSPTFSRTCPQYGANDDSCEKSSCTGFSDYTDLSARIGSRHETPGQSYDEYENNAMAGSVYGVYGFDEVLTDAQIQTVIDSIVVDGEDDARVLHGGACTACRAGLTTLAPGANSSDACVCQAGAWAPVTPADAVVAFNPANEVFDGSRTEDSGAARFEIATHGFTAVMKVKFADDTAWPRIFDFGNANQVVDNNIFLGRSSDTKHLYARIDDGSTVKCENHAAAFDAIQTWLPIYMRYHTLHGLSVTILDQASADNSAAPVACTVSNDRNVPSTRIGKSQVASENTFKGEIAGVYAFNRFLSDDEAKAVLATIQTGALDDPLHTACARCPAGQTTLAAGAESADACVCQAGSHKMRDVNVARACGASNNQACPVSVDTEHTGHENSALKLNDGDTSAESYWHAGYAYNAEQIFAQIDLQVSTNVQSVHLWSREGLPARIQYVQIRVGNDNVAHNNPICATNSVWESGVREKIFTCVASGRYLFLTWTDITERYKNVGEIEIYTENCMKCPAGLTTLAAGAESADACVCQSGSHQVGDLVSFFPLDGNLVDDLSSATMASSSTAYHTDAAHGPVLNANGNVYTITSPALATVLDASAYTVSFWIYFVSLPSNDHSNILTRWDNYDAPYSATGGLMIMASNNQKLQVAASAQSYYSATTLQESRWYHVSVVKTSSSSIELYLDGVLDVRWDATTRAMLNPINDIGIGSYCYSSSVSSTAATCTTETNNAMFYLMDLRFYSRALSGTEAATLATRTGDQANVCARCPAGQTTLSAGASRASECVCESGSYHNKTIKYEFSHQYRFENNLQDEQGSNHLSASGTYSFDSNAKEGTYAMKLPGDSYLESASDIDTAVTNELSFWLWLDRDTGRHLLFGIGDNFIMQVFDDSGTKKMYLSNINGCAETYIIQEFSWSHNQWYHFRVVIESTSKWYCYVDGTNILPSNLDGTCSGSTLPSGKLFIGRTPNNIWHNSYYLEGMIDDFTIRSTDASYTWVDACLNCPPTAPYTDPNHGATSADECAAVTGSCEVVGVTITPNPFPIRCSPNKFCVQYDEEANNIFCYGSSSGCLWNTNDCSTDTDCLKYDTSSPRYSDPGYTCDVVTTEWQKDACDKYNPLPTLHLQTGNVTSAMVKYVVFNDNAITSPYTLTFSAVTMADVLVISGSHYRYVTNLSVSGAYEITVSSTGESSFLGANSFGVTSGGGLDLVNDGVTSGLIAHWKFDGDFVDATGNYPLTTIGTEFVDGHFGQGIYVDSTNTFYTTSNFVVGPTSQNTFSFWVKKTRNNANDFLLYISADVPAHLKARKEIGVLFNSNNKINFYIHSGGDLITTTEYTDLTTWMHIVAVLDNEDQKIYVNAQLAASQALDNKLDDITDSPLRNSRPGNPNQLYYDDFRVYSRVLTDAEITALYQAGTVSDTGARSAITGASKVYTSPQVILRYNAIVCPTTDTDGLSCPAGSSLPSGSSSLDACACDANLHRDLSPIYDGRPPISAWSYSQLSSEAACNTPLHFGVHDGVDTSGTAGTGRTACFETVDSNNYLQLDMSTEVIVTGIQTMGRASDAQYVTLYQIEVSKDGATWTNAPCAEVDESGFCVGNVDAGSVKQNDLASKVVARYVKLIVKGYSGHESLRMSVLAQTCVSCPNVAWQHYVPA